MLSILLTTLLFAYFIYAVHVLDLHKPALEALCKPVADWFGEAGNPVTAILWTVVGVLLWAAWFGPETSIFYKLQGEITGMAFTVVVIDWLVGYRNWLQEKKRIIEDMGSRVNGTALDAVRLATKEGWLEDGSLVKIDLRGANLQDVALQNANLRQACLEGINLKSAKLIGSNLEAASLLYADLEEALLFRTTLKDACLNFTNLNKVVTDITVFQTASELYPRQQIDWEDVNQQKTTLRNVQLIHATLIDASLSNIDLRDAYIGKSDLAGIDLSYADLRDSTFYKTNLEGANLCKADLRRTYFNKNSLVGANLEGALYNDDTYFSDGFDPEAAGAIRVDE